jgi:hypothetical protein
MVAQQDSRVGPGCGASRSSADRASGGILPPAPAADKRQSTQRPPPRCRPVEQRCRRRPCLVSPPDAHSATNRLPWKAKKPDSELRWAICLLRPLASRLVAFCIEGSFGLPDAKTSPASFLRFLLGFLAGSLATARQEARPPSNRAAADQNPVAGAKSVRDVRQERCGGMTGQTVTFSGRPEHLDARHDARQSPTCDFGGRFSSFTTRLLDTVRERFQDLHSGRRPEPRARLSRVTTPRAGKRRWPASFIATPPGTRRTR